MLRKKWSGRRGEVLARCDKRNIELLVSPEEWPQKITGATSMLSMRCRECDTTVENRSITNFMNFGRFGCACISNKTWAGRRDEVLARCDERNIELLLSPEEWPQKMITHGTHTMLSLRCRVCETTVETTIVSSFMSDGCFGCACNSRHLRKWSGRRGEVLARCDERNIELLISPEEWPQKITGWKSMLSLRCRDCEMTVESTSASSFMNQGQFGCACNSSHLKKVARSARRGLPTPPKKKKRR
jgi:hypothetical protein